MQEDKLLAAVDQLCEAVGVGKLSVIFKDTGVNSVALEQVKKAATDAIRDGLKQTVEGLKAADLSTLKEMDGER